jgi:hypothetical protein
MRAVGAYYQYNMATEPPMPGTLDGTGVGAYYQYNMATEPPMPGTLNGLAGDEALKLLGSAAPRLLATYWAEQKTDAVWSPFKRRQGCDLYEVSNAIVERAQTQSFGGELSNLGVLFFSPRPLEDVRRAFIGTRYELLSVEAVFARQDRRLEPQMVFIAKLGPREIDDPEGGKVSLDGSAALLNGMLVLVEPVLVHDTTPLPNFEAAFRRQFGSAAVLRGFRGYGADEPPAAPAPEASKLLLPALVAAGGVAAYLIYKKASGRAR